MNTTASQLKLPPNLPTAGGQGASASITPPPPTPDPEAPDGNVILTRTTSSLGVKLLGNGTATATAAVAVVRNAMLTVDRTHRDMMTHHWECTVESVGESTFVATLRSLLDDHSGEKDAEIPVDEVGEDDRELLAPGAVFYWTIGYDISPAGTRRRASAIKFRRLPAWSKRDIRRVEQRAQALFEMFGAPLDADEQSRA